jgi:hypothetical protein
MSRPLQTIILAVVVFVMSFFFWHAVLEGVAKRDVLYQECGQQYCRPSEGNK